MEKDVDALVEAVMSGIQKDHVETGKDIDIADWSKFVDQHPWNTREAFQQRKETRKQDDRNS